MLQKNGLLNPMQHTNQKKATLISYCQNATKNGYSIPCNTQINQQRLASKHNHCITSKKFARFKRECKKNAKHRRYTSPFKTTANTPQDRHGDVSGRKWVELEREMSVGSSYLAGCLVKSLDGYGDLLCFG